MHRVNHCITHFSLSVLLWPCRRCPTTRLNYDLGAARTKDGPVACRFRAARYNALIRNSHDVCVRQCLVERVLFCEAQDALAR
jgi:hypothetical protein